MTTILILGGYGNTGRPLTLHLLTQTDARLIVAGRSFDKAKAFADELASPRVTPARVDASDIASLRTTLQNVTLCLVAAPTTSSTALVARACLDAGANYLDVQFAKNKLAALRALEPEICNAGLCFITEAGYHPGLPSALIRYAATKLDSVESAVTAGYLNIGNIPYTDAVDELVDAFKDYEAQIFKKGAWTKPSSWDMRPFDFGGEIGKRTCYSMFFEELRAIPEMYPTIKETGFYISGSNFVTDALITPVVMAGIKLFPNRGVRPMGKLLWWGMTSLSRPPYDLVLQVEAQGQKDGKPARVRARVEHPDGYELTAIPVVACLLQVLDGSARKPGLWMMGHLIEPARLMEDMQRMGARIETTIE